LKIKKRSEKKDGWMIETLNKYGNLSISKLFASLAVIWIKNYNFLTRRKVENLHRNEC
jgi:hypothetical protein